jgi:glycerol-3-phosphate dehydrogenase
VLEDDIIEVRARAVVNATGPWSDRIQRLDLDLRSTNASVSPAVRGSKGAHIAVARERVGNTYALTLIAPQDGRVMFVLPADSNAVIGTTDTYTGSSPDNVRASRDDVRYLLASANAFFPAARLTERDVVSAWAGIRPLLPAKGDAPGGASREHSVTMDERGLISVTGGKLTTFRVMASDVLDVVLRELDARNLGDAATTTTPLFGGDFASINEEIGNAVRATNDIPLAAHLVSSYGNRWRNVWMSICAPGGRFVVASGLPYTVGEMRYCLANEMAVTLGDLLIRRTQLAFEVPDHGLSAAAYLAPLLDLGPDQVEAYADDVERVFTIE